MKNKTITLLLLIAFSFLLFFSGIIRHDVDEMAYINLAKEQQFDAVGQVYVDTLSKGSCVLIKDNYVLSAAHVFIESDFREDTIMLSGQTIVTHTPYNDRVTDPKNVHLVIKGEKMGAKRIILHPNYLEKTSRGSCDLALIELSTPVQKVNPVIINNRFDELHADVVGVGYGVSGIADKPESVAIFNKKIAGQNVVDSIGGYQYLGMPTVLLSDFDHPTLPNCNKMGSPTPKPLEYICSGGDSGGPLFRKNNGQWELIGICSGANTNIEQLLTTGYYGQIMRWTRVSVFKKWITENTK